jgi:hypothetical protein
MTISLDQEHCRGRTIETYSPEHARAAQRRILTQWLTRRLDPFIVSSGERLSECGLTLHPEKTKIVYCKDDDRREMYPEQRFGFLG